jgi:hypothetical protein
MYICSCKGGYYMIGPKNQALFLHPNASIISSIQKFNAYFKVGKRWNNKQRTMSNHVQNYNFNSCLCGAILMACCVLWLWMLRI